MTILAAQRNRTALYDVTLRRSRTIRPGHDRNTTIYTHPVRKAQRKRNYAALLAQAQPQPANVPVRHYDLEDRIELVRQPSRPVSAREAILDVNVPSDGDWASLNAWRARYGLSPVTGE